jgi:hypothetical protein
MSVEELLQVVESPLKLLQCYEVSDVTPEHLASHLVIGIETARQTLKHRSTKKEIDYCDLLNFSITID